MATLFLCTIVTFVEKKVGWNENYRRKFVK